MLTASLALPHASGRASSSCYKQQKSTSLVVTVTISHRRHRLVAGCRANLAFLPSRRRLSHFDGGLAIPICIRGAIPWVLRFVTPGLWLCRVISSKRNQERHILAVHRLAPFPAHRCFSCRRLACRQSRASGRSHKPHRATEGQRRPCCAGPAAHSPLKAQLPDKMHRAVFTAGALLSAAFLTDLPLASAQPGIAACIPGGGR